MNLEPFIREVIVLTIRPTGGSKLKKKILNIVLKLWKVATDDFTIEIFYRQVLF